MTVVNKIMERKYILSDNVEKDTYQSTLFYILYSRENMITVNLYYTGKNGATDKFAHEMETSGLADKIRAEAGNLKYEYFKPLSDPETILLIDSWTDQAAIDRHHATPMMDELAKLREKYDLHMRAERYIDDGDLPDKDQAFLRK